MDRLWDSLEEKLKLIIVLLFAHMDYKKNTVISIIATKCL